MFSVDVAGHREPALQDLLRIVNGRAQELREALILGHVLVAECAPLCYCLLRMRSGAIDGR